MTDHKAIFGRSFDCACGRRHYVEPREVYCRDDAIEKLPEMCAIATSGRRAAVLMDVRTRDVAGAQAARALLDAGWGVDELLVPDGPNGSRPVCDRQTKDLLAAEMDHTDLVLAVGSGVISDLGKWLARDEGTVCATFATAASMNGYTSANVAPMVDGVKALFRARPPVVLVSSPRILREAPYQMTAAGLGDVLAKSVSSTDWAMNRRLFGDYYCQQAVQLIEDIEPLYVDEPHKLAARDPKAVAALFDALLYTGAAMTMAESSAPASGAEHLISHTLDMMSAMDGVEHDLHGRQVGVGTVLAADLYVRLVKTESPDFDEQPREVDRRFWGPLAGAVAKEYAAKLPRIQAVRERLSFPGEWDRLRGELAHMLRAPGLIHGCLRGAGAAASAAEIGCSRQRLLTAFMHAHEIRSRLTVLDLAWLAGLMPAAAREIVDTWA